MFFCFFSENIFYVDDDGIVEDFVCVFNVIINYLWIENLIFESLKL